MATTLAPIETERWTHLPEKVREEIDVFETELRRMQAGQVSEKVFLEFRLRHGTYGQRQDRVQMQRIKIPMGMLSADQLIRMGEIAEEYAVGVAHITTRQDFQIHFVDINNVPNLFRRLAEVGITTREACGNTVRNVTACPKSGVCHDEVFDVTPHARALAYFLLRHPDTQNFGRKFKIAFSGCAGHACGLARMHDIGAIAKVRHNNGVEEKGFEVWVGGGLGALPHQAKLYSEFVPAQEMLPLAQSIARVFARLGEKKNRAKARIKFLIANLGLDPFKELVAEEREKLTPDPRWQSDLEQAMASLRDEPLKPGADFILPANASEDFRRWLRTNTRPQRQPGYSMVEVFLPLGDITSDQLRGLGNLCKRFVKDTIRTTVEQNFLIRWVPNADLPAFYEGLQALDLAEPGAGTLRDIVACPGTDSCKLGITSSRGLAALLHAKTANGMSDLAGRTDLRIKISGCFNSCGQHHVADIGFFGSVQRKQNHNAPVLQVVLGGTTDGNAESYGLSVGKVPAKNAPEAVRVLSQLYSSERNEGESFSKFAQRIGKARLKETLANVAELPPYDEDPSYYQDIRQPWEYRKSVGVGECAGEVVDQAEFMLEDADRLNFEATLALDEGRHQDAAEGAFQATKCAADALLSTRGLLLSDKYDTVAEFRKQFYDTGQFWAPFAENFFRAAEEGSAHVTPEQARLRVEETTLFIEQAQTVYSQSP